MEKQFNITELASTLAQRRVHEEFMIDHDDFKNSAVYSWDEEQNNGEYTEEAQEVFNHYYDQYFDILIDM